MIILRPYQINLIDNVIKAVKSGYRKILVVAPAGAGKTVVMGGLIAQLTLLLGIPNVLISVPYNNLVQQIQESLFQQELTACIETYTNTLNRVKIATNIFIVDECHHIGSPSGQNLLHIVQSDLLIGFTATPFRLDKTPLLLENGGPFEILISGPSIDELTEHGYLAHLNYYSYPLLKEVTIEYYYLRYGTRGKREIVTYKVDNREHKIIEEYQEGFAGIPSFVFCKTVKQAENIAAQFNASGIPAGYISCYNPKRMTTNTINQFRNGGLMILCACNMASEGVDISRAKLVIMARKIQSSVTLFIQQAGRALRPYQNQEANILDLTGNCYRFGSIQQAYNMEVI